MHEPRKARMTMAFELAVREPRADKNKGQRGEENDELSFNEERGDKVRAYGSDGPEPGAFRV